jgi:streptogramin lyase
MSVLKSVGTVTVAATLAAGAVQARDAAPPGVSATIATPGYPALVTVAYGSVWVAGHRNSVVYRIDPRTNRVTGKVRLPDPINGVLTSGAGAIWAQSSPADGSVSYVYRIDPHTMRVLGRREGIAAIVAAGSLWVSSVAQHAVLRIDPASGRVLARIAKLGVDPYRVNPVGGAGFGSVWVYSPDGAVVRISTATNRVTAVVPLPRGKAGGSVQGGVLDGGPIAFAGGSAWLVDPAGLFRIDPATNAAELSRVRIEPFTNWALPGIAVTPGGHLLVRTSNTKVVEVDPRTGTAVRAYPAAGGGGEIAVGFGALWVANAGSDSVWRIPLATSTGRPTKAAYIEKADAICRDVNARIRATGVRPTEASLNANGAKVLALVAQKIKRLRALARPVADGPALARFFALLEAKRKAFARDVAAARAGRYDPTKSTVDQVGFRLVAAARAYGFLSCP